MGGLTHAGAGRVPVSSRGQDSGALEAADDGESPAVGAWEGGGGEDTGGRLKGGGGREGINRAPAWPQDQGNATSLRKREIQEGFIPG